jgi:hypothetical protein
VPSVAGVTYLDGGFPLLIVGSFAFGFGLRWLATRWVYNRHLGDFRAAAIVIASSFALVAARTNTVHAAWWCIYTLIIACMIYLVFSDRVGVGRAPMSAASMRAQSGSSGSWGSDRNRLRAGGGARRVVQSHQTIVIEPSERKLPRVQDRPAARITAGQWRST